MWGYEEVLKVLADPADPEHEHEPMLEWVGGPFDAEAFDIDAVNRALSPSPKKGWSYRG